MVDFRYHLISLIGVILALALGILAGSGFLGGPILEQLQSSVDEFRGDKDRLQEVITEQDARLDRSEDFARAAEALMVRGQLAGDEVVVFQFEGTDGRLLDGVHDALAGAGAQVISQITFREKLALASAPIQDELSLLTGSLTGEPAQLLEDLAAMVGQRAAAAAVDGGQADTPNAGAAQRFQSLLEDLERSEFVGSAFPPEGPPVPEGATFIVVGGSEGRPPFKVAPFASAFAQALTERGATTMVVEASSSTWGLVQSVRSDTEARARAATVDNADTTMG
ncbi:MAG: copper transporter, partial [Actinobacteria bacterium]|nr:copper transporter [Actinomycetota bacterium]